MEKTLIVANWKENFTVAEAERWAERLNKELRMSASGDSSNLKNEGDVDIVICPSFVLIPVLYSSFSILHSSFSLGAQDVSKFEEGQYTGEVSAKMLKDFVDYVIVGHSERRKYFGETDGDVVAKSILALKHDLIPIVCVSNIEEARSWKVEARKEARGLKLERAVFVYEPVEHISTGGDFHPDDPEHANLMAKEIKAEVGRDVRVLYGGSVTSENVKSFVSQQDINGVLVGQASLDAKEFVRVINNLTI